MGEVSKVTGALKAKPLYHSSPAPDQEGYLPAPSPISLLRREPCRGRRPHRDIPSVCRQLTLFRCPGISSQPSTSHSPSTSSSQQILKPEKRRKWRPYVSRLSVSATGQPAQSGTWKLPPPPTWKNQAGKPWNRRSEGKEVEVGKDWKHWAPIFLHESTVTCVCMCSCSQLTHNPILK